MRGRKENGRVWIGIKEGRRRGSRVKNKDLKNGERMKERRRGKKGKKWEER